MHWDPNIIFNYQYSMRYPRAICDKCRAQLKRIDNPNQPNPKSFPNNSDLLNGLEMEESVLLLTVQYVMRQQGISVK